MHKEIKKVLTGDKSKKKRWRERVTPTFSSLQTLVKYLEEIGRELRVISVYHFFKQSKSQTVKVWQVLPFSSVGEPTSETCLTILTN
jgi:hypothetical protein